MSVINKVLRDLDERQQHKKSGAYTPAASAPQPLHWGWILAAITVTSMIVIGALNWWWGVAATPSQPLAQVTPEPVVVAEEAKVEPPVQTEVIATNSTPEPVIEPVAAVTNSEPEPKPFESVPEVAASTPEPEIETATPAPPPAAPSSFAVTRVELTPEQLAENHLNKARAALRKGERELGQELLEQALIVKPDHVEVRNELAAYWYGRGLTSRAISLLQQGLDIKPDQSEWQLLYARILERVGRIEVAYNMLLNVRLDVPESAELVELRAVAANQLSYYLQAAKDFELLATNFAQPRWWIAAAVAYEDAGNIEAAIHAYQQAQQQPGTEPEAVAYIEQRLLSLAPANTEAK